MPEGASRPSEALAGEASQAAQRRPWAFVLFVVPVAAVVVPALYSRIDPELGGVPFFLWYQFAAVVLGGAVTGVVYVLTGTERRAARSGAGGRRRTGADHVS